MKWYLKHVVHGNKPRAVQVEAMKRSGGRAKFGQYLEQRLGKSSLTLNEFMMSDCDTLVVVAPNTFKMDWKYLPAEWGLADVCRAGAWPKDPLPYSECGKSVRQSYAVNYEAIWQGAFDPLCKLLNHSRCMLVLDESSNIKNPQAKTSKAAIELSKRAHMVRELNGTPLTQNVMDFYPQLRCLGELNGVNPYAFRNTYGAMGGYMGKQIVGVNDENIDRLYALLDRCSFRALRRDWLKGHIEPTLVPTHLEMTGNQHKHYGEMMEDFYTMVQGMDVPAEMVLTQMTKLQQISSCLVMNKGDVRHIEPPNKNPKIQAILDVHQSGPGKTIVVYMYKPSGGTIFEAATKAKLNPVWIRGQMKPDDIQEAKRRFNDDPGCRVLVAQEQAVSMGHTLAGGKDDADQCSRMVFYENSFSLRDRLQTMERNYVEGRERGIYDLICSPMDQIVVDALGNKKDLADAVDDVVAAVRGRKY